MNKNDYVQNTKNISQIMYLKNNGSILQMSKSDVLKKMFLSSQTWTLLFSGN